MHIPLSFSSLTSAGTSAPLRTVQTSCLLRTVVVAASARQFTTSLRALLPEETQVGSDKGGESPDGSASKEEEESRPDRDPKPISYRRWLEKHAVYWQFPAESGPNYLGSVIDNWRSPRYGRPFPTNPTFKPPPPMSDADRENIYKLWHKAPAEQTVRDLSTKYGVSIDRINAVIKLKRHEKNWDKNTQGPLQTALAEGMERYMGVKSRIGQPDEYDPESELQYEIDEDAAFVRDFGEKKQSTQILWELVGEGDDPIIAPRLEPDLVKKAQRLAKSRRKIENFPTVRVPPSKPGRPTWTFVDVGEKFAGSRTREVQEKAARWKGTVQRQAIANRRTV